MANLLQNIQGMVARSLKAAQAMADSGQSSQGGQRIGKYNEPYSLSLVPTKHLLADEGSYWSITNPTAGTGVAFAQVVAFSATSALFAIFNANKAGGARSYLDTLRLILTGTAPATTVSMEFSVVLDAVGASRLPSAGFLKQQPLNTNGDDGTTPATQVYAFTAAALTVPTAVNPSIVARPHIATGLGITGDEYIVQFGSADHVTSTGPTTAVRASTPSRMATHAPPVIIAPQQWCILHMWWLTGTTNVPNFEYELTGWER
jgi:hypothetical protein